MNAAEEAIARTLATALESDPSVSTRPGQLRAVLAREVPGDQHRPCIHQVAAAAEENVPATLLRLSGPTVDSLTRISAELAAARDWNTTVAERAVRIWATALGVGRPAE